MAEEDDFLEMLRAGEVDTDKILQMGLNAPVTQEDIQYLLGIYRCLSITKAGTPEPSWYTVKEIIRASQKNSAHSQKNQAHWPIFDYGTHLVTSAGDYAHGNHPEAIAAGLTGTVALQGWRTAHAMSQVVKRKLAAEDPVEQDEDEEDENASSATPSWRRIEISDFSHDSMKFAFWCAAQEAGLVIVNYEPSLDQSMLYYDNWHAIKSLALANRPE